jgi:hypothetical protein
MLLIWGYIEWFYSESEACTLRDGGRVLTGTQFMCEIIYHNFPIAKEREMQLTSVLLCLLPSMPTCYNACVK